MRNSLLAFVLVSAFSLQAWAEGEAPPEAGAQDAPAAQAEEDAAASAEAKRQARLEAIEKALAAGRVSRAAEEMSALYGPEEAAFRMGARFESGDGVAPNRSLAWQWFSKAADQGHAEAQLKAAEYLYEGIGTPMNRARALTYYKMAAEQGNVRAKSMLGTMYVRGIGGRVNQIDGVRLLTEAAGEGDAAARSELERLRAAGHPVQARAGGGAAAVAGTGPAEILDEVQSLLRPWRSGDGGGLRMSGPIAVTEAEGGYDVVLPGVVWTKEDQSLDVGTVKGRLTPRPSGDYQVDIFFPNRSVMRDAKGNEIGSLSFETVTFSGTWLPDLDMMLEYQARLSGLRLEGEDETGHGVFTVESLDARRTATPGKEGRRDIGDSVIVSGFTGKGDGFEVMAAERFALTTAYRGLDLHELRRLAVAEGVEWGWGLPINGENPIPINRMVDSIGGFGVNAAIFGARFADQGSVDSAELRFGIDVAGNRSGVELSYRHAGLVWRGDAVDPAAVPSAANLLLVIENAPFGELPEVHVGGAEPSGAFFGLFLALAQAVEQAETKVVVREASMRADSYAIDLEGSVLPLLTGFEGAAVARVHGLEKLLAALRGADSVGPQPLFDLVQGLARREQDADGRPVDVFEMEFRRDGSVLVNGTPINGGADG